MATKSCTDASACEHVHTSQTKIRTQNHLRRHGQVGRGGGRLLHQLLPTHAQVLQEAAVGHVPAAAQRLEARGSGIALLVRQRQGSRRPLTLGHTAQRKQAYRHTGANISVGCAWGDFDLIAAPYAL